MALKKKGTPEKIKVVKEPIFHYEPESTIEVSIEAKSKQKKEKK